MQPAFENTVEEGAAVPDVAFEALLSVRVKKVADLLEAAARQFTVAGQGLRFTEVRILACLASRAESSVLEISRDLSMDKAWISRLVRSLCEKRLVERRGQGEGRLAPVSLTAAGREIYIEFVAQVLQHEGSVMQKIDEGAAARLFDQLELNVRAVLAQLDQRPAQPR